MIDYAIFVLISTLVQMALIYIWFDSEILSVPFGWCLKRKNQAMGGLSWFVFTLLTCPTCLGFWFAWAVVAAGLLIPDCPLAGYSLWKTIFMIFYTGLAVAVLSKIVDGWMPDPITSRLFFDFDDEEENNGEVDSVDDEVKNITNNTEGEDNND